MNCGQISEVDIALVLQQLIQLHQVIDDSFYGALFE